jgi:carbon-monoxide dehydrogenase medium subunit
MKSAPFSYAAPRSLDEAVAELGRHGDEARVLAGGQSLVPMMAFRLARPSCLVDINAVSELDFLRLENGVLRIGALTRHAAFEEPATDGTLGRLLTRVMHHIAHWPIRTRGTFCGSLAHADPASEWCLVATTLGAELVLRGPDGERIVAAEDFFHGLMTTAIGEGEILAEARLPDLGAVRFGFTEFSRRAGDYALAAALAVLRIENGAIVEARVGVGGAEAAPRRIAEAEAILTGETPKPETLRAAAEAAAAAIDPMEDLQADAEFRRDLVRAMVGRALAEAAP